MDSSGVAVLYLATPPRDTATAAIADGLTEEIIARLSQVRGLHPASRHASARYRSARGADPRQVGRELAVRYVLDGSVRRQGERLRVVLVVTDAAAGFNVWGRTFERSLSDIFSIQDSVAIQVAEAILGGLSTGDRAALAPVAASTNVDAYQAFLRGRVAIRGRTAASASRAVAEYRQAVALDPSFARGWAALAHALALARDWGWQLAGVAPESTQALSQRAAARALALDSSAESWLAAAMAERAVDMPRALRMHERALRLDSANVEIIHQLAWGLLAMGAMDSAIAVERAVLRRDPFYGYAYAGLAAMLNSAGRPAEALEAATQGIAIDSMVAPLHFQLADALLRQGQVRRAQTAIDRAEALGFERAGIATTRAIALLAAGDTAGVRRSLPELERLLLADSVQAAGGLAYNSAGQLSGLYAQLSDVENAVRWLRRVAPWPRRFYAYMWRRHWLWDPIRTSPAFNSFLAELGAE